MHSITTYKSSKGNTRFTHTIFGDVHPKSRAAYILLYNKLREQDEDYLLEKDWRTLVQFNIDFLKEREKECGSLTCAFCGKPNLIIQAIEGDRVPKSIMATVDHFIPQSVGGGRIDKEIFVECCSKCNGKKGSKVYDLYPTIFRC